jgi:hypothetical protein
VRSYLNWLDQEGFYIPVTWDYTQGIWAGPGLLKLTDFQRRIAAHVFTPDERGILPYNTVILGETKKSGKTAWGASIMEWASEDWGEGTEVYSTASTQKQTIGRAFGDVAFHIGRKAELAQVKITEDKILYPDRSFIMALAKNWKAAEGSRHSLTHWDELHTFTSENDYKMWDALTPIPTVKNSIRLITTYAGIEGESELLWDLYLNGVDNQEHPEGKGHKIPGMEDLPVYANGRQFTLWSHDNIMPWQTKEYLAQQRKDLRAGTYLRYHENRWASSEEAFIPKEWWGFAERAFDQSAWNWKEHPYRNFPVILAVDAATKKDTIAVVGVCYDAIKGHVIVLFHKIWNTRGEDWFDFEETVEKYILEAVQKFQIISVVYDPKDFHQTSVRLVKKGLHMVQYTQSAGNIQAASQALYETLKSRALKTYPDEEVRKQVILTVAKVQGDAFQIIKKNNRSETPNDYTVALAMAVKKVLESGGVDVEEVIRIQAPFSDTAVWKDVDFEQPVNIPFQLRD